MDVRLEQTDGLGRHAEVWIDGHLLEVCDGVSGPTGAMTPGLMEGVKFVYMAAEGFSWEEAVNGNPSRRKNLESVRGWSYVGYGRVLDIMPVRIDFGLLTMEDANWTNDESLIGKYVRVPIERLEVAPAGE